ncbi:MAG: FAD-dependent monooxygenase [Thiobacillus sp.]|nr:FAD-dependent monooxygenase [Thiobacillus sp.]
MDAGLTPLIVGAGPVGAVCALALAQQDIPARVLEAGPENAPADGRTLALSHGAQLILSRLGVWQRLADVTPIARIHISQRGALGATRLDAAELDVPALGYVLSYATLTAALKQALHEAAVPVEYGVAVEAVQAGNDAAAVMTAAGARRTALAVVADGGRSLAAATAKFHRDYAQMALVCDVRTERPHAHQAYERFTPDGPVALLPRHDRYGLVWTAHPDVAERLRRLDDPAFLDALHAHFGGRQGRFLQAGPRKVFPLMMRYAGSEAGARVVRIGNAAQTLHPVAGQGFNLGLRDAFELALACADVPPNALGSAAMLAAYARGRRADVAGGLGFTDFLVRAFSNDFALLRHARGLGLLTLEALPPLKNFVARRMMFGARG